MAYDDNKLGRLFPTRTGDATGTANERKMLDILDGADNIRTKVQRFVEGTKVTTTRLRTRAGNPEFITEVTDDDDEPESIYMDTGVVDLLSIAPDDPRSMESAPLYYGVIQRTYYALKKLLGKIFPPSVKSRKPPVEGEAGKSFKKKEGADLLTKKECAAKCPASMFTGKARLYAQAHYGGELKNWKWTLETPEGLSPRLVHDNGSVLTTNSGIYRDAEYKHWLVTIHPGGALVTKLVRDDKVKPLVRHLRNPDKAADWSKIEAYILAYSTPSEDVNFNIAIPGAPAPQMLGYGWKFNWLGDKADIIEHIEGFPDHRSTHFRLTIHRDAARYVPPSTPALEAEQQRWSIKLSVVEGPITWHNPRFVSVISYPDWLLSTLSIFGVTAGASHANNVPIYCFYNQDNTLEVFRHTHVEGISGVAAKRDSYPPTWGLTCDWTTDPSVAMNATVYDTYGTFFTEGGGGSWKQRTASPSTTGFQCSKGTTIGQAEFYTFEDRATAGKIINNTGVTWGGYGWENPQPSVVADVGVQHAVYGTNPVYLSDGVVGTSGTIALISDNVPGPPGLYQGSFLCFHQFIGLSYDAGTHSQSRKSLIVVPFYDAEAAYIYGSLTTTRTSSGYSGDGSPGMGNAWGAPLRVLVDGSVIAEWTLGRAHSGSWGMPTVGYTAWTDRVSTTTEILLSKLVFSNGSTEFVPTISLSPFFAGVESVEQQFNTRSNTLGSVYGFGANKLDGFPAELQVLPPPFIGWA